jgi:hypothetical protein
MASEALRTWSAEQLKSVKSGLRTGRCILTAEIDSRAELGMLEDLSRDWISVRMAWWMLRGRAARSFKVGCERMPEGRSLTCCRLGMSARKITVSSNRVTYWGFGWRSEEAMPKGMLFNPK